MFNKKQTLLVITSLFVFSSAYAWEVKPAMETTSQTWTKMEEVMPSTLNITQVNSIDSKKIEVVFSDNTNTYSTGSELKIFNQLDVIEIKAVETNTKQIEVKISWEDLTPWSNLSLISLTDLDLNADFTITWENFSLDNLATPTWSKITLKDKSTLVIDLKSDLAGVQPNLKLLKEVPVLGISNVESKLLLDLWLDLKSQSSYILMVISLFDSQNKDVAVENWVFDFLTPEIKAVEMETVNESLSSTGEALVDNNTQDLTLTGETLVEKNIQDITSTWEILVENNIDSEVLNVADVQSGAIAIEDVAMTAQTTPDTGTKEIFIVLLSLMIWLGVFAIKNKKA